MKKNHIHIKDIEVLDQPLNPIDYLPLLMFISIHFLFVEFSEFLRELGDAGNVEAINHIKPIVGRRNLNSERRLAHFISERLFMAHVNRQVQ